MKSGQKMRILKDRRTETVVCRTIFQRVYTNVRLFKLHLEIVYRIRCTKNFRRRHLHLSLSYKYNFSANFSRIFQRIQPRDIELNKSWDFDAVQSDVEIIFCSDLQREFGWFWQFCEYRIPNVKRVIYYERLKSNGSD